MLIKFFNHGKGDGRAPVQYVTNSSGREEALRVVMRGDPDQPIALINSIARK